MAEKKFEFGKNWQKFLKESLSEDVIIASGKRLAEFFGGKDLKGKSFLDIGAGSGLHSLAAIRMNADKVVSIDADEKAVSCAKKLKSDNDYKNWEIYEGSLLDRGFISGLGLFDIVYCWGVAHHTGAMWEALENLNIPVKKGGFLFVAIYNNVEGRRGSKMWWRIKKLYNHSPLFIKKIMEWFYISWSFIVLLFHFKNPFSVIRLYKNKRGMSWKTDLIDWLGGFPYEYARPEEIFKFYKERGFELVNLKTTNYIGCNQFLFIKKD